MHSYSLENIHSKFSVCETFYGSKFVSVFNKENIFGIQFHPEKSHDQGSQILLNFYKKLMLRNRIIPFLLIDKEGNCIKTTKFEDRNYIGDILNNIRIFSEKKVDELVILDIDASRNKNLIKFDLISR